MTDSPDLPRTLSPRAKRRTWAEQPVRLWLVLAGVVLAVVVWIMSTTLGDHLSERRLILAGEEARGEVVSINADARAYDVERDERVRVTLQITRAGVDAEPVSQKVRLSARPGQTISVGDELPLRVRPLNPSATKFVVTDVLEVPSIWRRWVAVPPLLGLVGFLLLMAALRRRSVLRVAREGRRVPATVLSSKGSALAPRSRVLNVRPDGSDRPATLLHPMPAPDTSLDVLRATRGPTLAANLYE